MDRVKQRLKAAEAAVSIELRAGLDQRAPVVRLIRVVGFLLDAAEPLQGRRYDRTIRGNGHGIPGSSTTWARAELNRLLKAIDREVARTEARLAGERAGQPRCAECGTFASARDRFCSQCGHGVESGKTSAA